MVMGNRTGRGRVESVPSPVLVGIRCGCTVAHYGYGYGHLWFCYAACLSDDCAFEEYNPHAVSAGICMALAAGKRGE